MKKMILAALLVVSTNAFAVVIDSSAKLVQKFEENGVVTEVYVQETYADETTYCSQTIVVKTDKATAKVLSTEAKERCNRIR